MVRVLLMAGGLAAFRPARAQQAPPDSTRDSLARAARVQRLPTQRITGTRLAPASTHAWASVAVRSDALGAHELASVTPGPGAAARMLAQLPGTAAFDDQGTRAQPTLDFRGWTLSPVVGVPQGVSVFLDGVRINEADAQQINFDLVPEEAIASAELVRGPVALFGKNTLAGAVLISTQRGGPDARLETDVSSARFGFRAAHLLASGARTLGALGDVDALVLASGSEESGFRDVTPATTRMLFTTIGRRAVDERSDVALSVLYAHDRVFQAGSLPESWLARDRRLNYTGGDFFAPDLLHVALRGARSIGSSALRGNAYVRRNASEQFNVNVDDASTRAFVRGVTAGSTLEWSASLGRALLTTGAEYSHDAVRYRVHAEPTADAPDLPPDCDASGLCENARAFSDNAALFAQLMVSLVENHSSGSASGATLALTAAARGDWVRIPFRDLREPDNDGAGVYRRVSPRVGLTLRPAAGASAYVSVGTGFRTPAALELACASEDAPCSLPFSLGDDPPLEPVTAVNYEAGASWTPAGWLAADISLYRADVRNEIAFAASSRTAGFFRNVPRTRRQGLELSVRAERMRQGGGVRAFARYGYVDARYESSLQLASAIPDAPPVSPGNRLALTPAHRGAFGLGGTRLFGSLLLDGEVRLNAVSSQFLRGDEANRQQPLPGYASTGARVSVQWTRATVACDIQNLGDARFETFGVFAPNFRAPPGGDPAFTPGVERFVTPGYPRTVTLSLRLAW